MKILESSFFKNSSKKTHKVKFFEFYFQRKCSRGSCATFNENLYPCRLSVLRNLSHKFENLTDVTKSKSEKNKHRRDGMLRLGSSRNVQWSTESATE